ncbi:MAG: SxtJ family membrane protein [Candidatus Omnitrophica bacterium]|nr:SxtJ family membrane protein [Candidatus Omnitrophota bacterium]
MAKTEGKNLRSFGLILGSILLALSIRLCFKGQPMTWIYFVIAGSAFGIAGLVAPSILRPIYKVWMRIAHIIGWLNTKFLLLLIFYLIFLPIGLFMRLTGKDLLGLKMDRVKESYWIARPRKKVLEPAQYEKQF